MNEQKQTNKPKKKAKQNDSKTQTDNSLIIMHLKEAPWFLGKWKEEKDAVEKKLHILLFIFFIDIRPVNRDRNINSLY